MAALTGAGLLSLSATPPTLEELFLRHYGDQVTDPTWSMTRTHPPPPVVMAWPGHSGVRNDHDDQPVTGRPGVGVARCGVASWSGWGC